MLFYVVSVYYLNFISLSVFDRAALVNSHNKTLCNTVLVIIWTCDECFVLGWKSTKCYGTLLGFGIHFVFHACDDCLAVQEVQVGMFKEGVLILWLKWD